MEVMDNNRLPDEKPENYGRKRHDVSVSGSIYLGVVLIAAGMLWLFKNLGWVGYGFFNVVFSWQMLLVVIGGYLLSVRKWVAGTIVGGAGAVFLLMDVLRIHINTWRILLPVVVIALGISLLVSRFTDNR